MTKIEEMIGIEFESYIFEVEKYKIKELAEAIGDDNEIYFSLEAAKKEGYEGIPIPPTYLTVVEYWGGENILDKLKDFNLNPVKILHGEQEYEFIKDIYAGDILRVTSMVSDAVVKHGSTGGMDLITIEKHYVNQNDELVAQSRGVLVHRH